MNENQDYDEGLILKRRRVKHSRKERQCSVCDQLIKVGDAYTYEAGLDPDGKWFQQHFHSNYCWMTMENDNDSE